MIKENIETKQVKKHDNNNKNLNFAISRIKIKQQDQLPPRRDRYI